MRRNSENGNILILILVAVILFGALSYTVASMLRSGNAELIGEQQASILADDILNYARQVRQAVQAIRISNGCEDEDISFENSTVSGYEHTPVADDACKVFHTDGGGLSYLEPNADFLDPSFSAEPRYGEWYIPTTGCVIGVGTGQSAANGDCSNAASEVELTLFLPYIKRVICDSINEKVGGAVTPGGDPEQERNSTFGGAHPPFIGTFDFASGIDQLQFVGLTSGCYEGFSNTSRPPEDSYTFYLVLRVR